MNWVTDFYLFVLALKLLFIDQSHILRDARNELVNTHNQIDS